VAGSVTARALYRRGYLVADLPGELRLAVETDDDTGPLAGPDSIERRPLGLLEAGGAQDFRGDVYPTASLAAATLRAAPSRAVIHRTGSRLA
jgi:hypothetical protein